MKRKELPSKAFSESSCQDDIIDLGKDELKISNYFRMSIKSFEELRTKITPIKVHVYQEITRRRKFKFYTKVVLKS